MFRNNSEHVPKSAYFIYNSLLKGQIHLIETRILQPYISMFHLHLYESALMEKLMKLNYSHYGQNRLINDTKWLM